MEYLHFYHCATKGLETNTLFNSVSAFIAGMNRIAFCYASMPEDYKLKLIAFCLMDNHVHFILHGTESGCLLFMNKYKRLTSLWAKTHCPEIADFSWEIGCWKINDEESLVEKISYVHRNPFVAHLPYTVSGYRWSSANLIFSDRTAISGNKVGSLSSYGQRRLFESRIKVPEDWLVLPDGMIWPGSYTEISLVERLFKTPSNYQFEMNKHVEDKVNGEMMSDAVSLPDEEIRRKIIAESVKLFDKENISELSVSERLSLARIVRKDTGTSTKQLARILRICPQDLARLV